MMDEAKTIKLTHYEMLALLTIMRDWHYKAVHECEYDCPLKTDVLLDDLLEYTLTKDGAEITLGTDACLDLFDYVNAHIATLSDDEHDKLDMAYDIRNKLDVR